MLGKLIKQEWKATWKTIVLLNLFLLALTLLGVISFASQLWSIEYPLIQILGVSSLMVYYFTLFGISFAVMIYLYVHFYKNMYTSEGYLMHTLPVTPRQLILSKVILGSLYILVTFAHIMISVFVLVFSFGASIGEFTFSEIMNEFVTEVIPLFNFDFSFFIIIGLLAFVLTSLSGLLMGFASVSLGQLFSKHKVLGCFVSYFGIQMVMQFASVFIMLPSMTYGMLKNPTDPSFMVMPMLIATLVSSVVFIAILYITTELIMSKKLNLD